MKRFGPLSQHWWSPKCLKNIWKTISDGLLLIFTSQSHKQGKKRSLTLYFFGHCMYEVMIIDDHSWIKIHTYIVEDFAYMLSF
jgi:hypothetical protein